MIFDKSATFLGWENNTSFPTSNAKPYRGKDIPCNRAHSIDLLPFVDHNQLKSAGQLMKIAALKSELCND